MTENDTHDIRTRLLARIDDRSHPPGNTDQLADTLGLTDPAEHQMLGELLHTLNRQGVLAQRADGSWRRTTGNDVIGRVTLPAHGEFAIVIPVQRDQPLVRVRGAHILDARHGDLVQCVKLDRDHSRAGDNRKDEKGSDGSRAFQPKGRAWSKGHGKHRKDGNNGGDGERKTKAGDEISTALEWARIVRVIDRRPNTVIGVLDARGRKTTVRLLRNDAPRKLPVVGALEPGSLDGAIVKVLIEPNTDKKRGRSEVARVLEILGSAFSPDDDELLAAAEYGLKLEYSDEALAEAREVQRIYEEEEREPKPDRQDLTHLHVVTIDPPDARDFDDGISIEQHKDGSFTIGVHIADVSHYVQPGMALDIEAADRGCTVYLPVRTLHMLPLDLAGNICSLRPGVPRFAKTAFMHYSADGTLLDRKLVRSEIVNGARLTYDEAFAIARDRFPQDELSRFADWVPDAVKAIQRAADVLNQRRRDAGSFQLDIPRPHLTVDDNGRFVKVEPEHDDESHRIVEECMLAANQTVAKFLNELQLPSIARIHPEPSQNDIEGFVKFLVELGFELPGGKFTPKGVQKLLDDIADREGGPAVHLALLKSMQRAVYSADPSPHYALQFTDYLHFTSPIRRYPDLMVHQIIDAYLDAGRTFMQVEGAAVGGPLELPEAQHARFSMATPTVASHCTDRAIKADAAESRVVKTRILRELAANHLHETMMATVTGGSRNGLFCQIDTFLLDGFLGRRGMNYDGFDPAGGFAWDISWGAKTQRFRVGDRVKVTIEVADPILGELELSLAEAPWLGTGKPLGPRGAGGSRNGRGGGGGRGPGRKGGKGRPQRKGRGANKGKGSRGHRKGGRR